MPTYAYRARDERGQIVTGTLVASTVEQLSDQLKRMGYLVTQAKEVAGAGSLESWWLRLQPVSYDEMALWYVQLSRMVKVGIPLLTVECSRRSGT